MGLPFNNFLCRIFRRLSQTRAEINIGPLAPKRTEYGEGGFVSVYRLATRNLALFVKNLMPQGFQQRHCERFLRQAQDMFCEATPALARYRAQRSASGSIPIERRLLRRTGCLTPAERSAPRNDGLI